jgi:hypothetical protein
VTAYINFSSGGWTQVASQTQTTQAYNGTNTGQAGFTSGTVTAALDPRGNGDYQVTIASDGICGNQDYNLTPNAPSSGTVSIARPTISSSVYGMWWFGAVGKNDSNNGYYDTATIQGSPNWSGATLTYAITQGNSYARLTCTNCNTASAQAIAQAPANPGCAADVVVSASLNGFKAASTLGLVVNSAAGRLPAEDYTNLSTLDGGYQSQDYFIFTDKCGYGMSSVAYHEQFSGMYHTYWPGGASSFWSSPPSAAGWSAYTLPPNLTNDVIKNRCVDSGCTPQTVAPNPSTLSGRSNLGQLLRGAVSDLQQIWYVGDACAGGCTTGIPIPAGKQTLYQDHGEDLTTW